MTRPCMNPASVIFPERDEPADLSEAGRGRDNGRPLTAQKTARTRHKEEIISILNYDHAREAGDWETAAKLLSYDQEARAEAWPEPAEMLRLRRGHRYTQTD